MPIRIKRITQERLLNDCWILRLIKPDGCAKKDQKDAPTKKAQKSQEEELHKTMKDALVATVYFSIYWRGSVEFYAIG